MKRRVTCAGFPVALAAPLKKNVFNCLRVLSAADVHYTIIATSDPEMRRMNRQFRGKDKTTDVLTFVYPDLVEIYLSLPVARRQARERRITLAQECRRLLVHGICHAMGFDHHTRDEFIEMRRREFEVLVQCENA